jgi:DNA-binding transcriptional LysR family regulator
MDSNLLKIFIAVANNKSISLGAKELGFTQSNVTLRIKQLEKNIGYTLFHRVPKGVQLTHEGEKLYPYAIEIVKKVEEANFYMSNLNHQEVLKIGSTQANATTRLIPFITKLNKKFPDMKLELFTNATLDALDELLHYKIDIAFLSGNPNHPDIEILKEYKDEIYLIKPKMKKSTNTILAYKSTCAYYLYLQEYLYENEKQSYDTTFFENYETILGCVKAGMGISLLPKTIIDKFGYKDAFEVTKIDCDLHTHLVCKKDYIPLISKDLKKLRL